MKLKKEDVYINLQGKSKEYRKEIVNFLLSINEPCEGYIKKNIQIEHTLECFDGMWFTYGNSGNKQEVTIQQLKEILQPMEGTGFDLTKTIVTVSNKEEALKLREYALKKGFKETSGLNLNNWRCNKTFSFLINKEIVTSNIYKEEQGLIEYSFNDIFKTEPTLQQQLEKAKAEVKRLKKDIEDSKIKIGDFVIRNNILFKVKEGLYCLNELNNCNDFKKIKDQDLINKLNELIK